MYPPRRAPSSFALAVALSCSGGLGGCGASVGPHVAPGGASGGVVGTAGNSGNTGGAPGTGGLTGSGGGGMPSGTGGMVTTGGSGTGGGSGGGSGGSSSGSGGRNATGGASSTGGRTSSTGGASPGLGGAGGGGGGGSAGGGSAGAGGTPAGGTQPYKGVANSTCADMARMNVAWFYNWTLSPGACASPEFVPMVAGKNEKTSAAVTAAITRAANAGYKTVLGFNEPNKVDQANLTVAQVIEMWPAMTANAALRVGSPATSGDGQAWFTDFMNQATARSLRVDFIALHWYGWNAGSCDSRALTLENYIKWAEAIPGNRPIWITEWGCLNQSNPDGATVQAFYQGALAMFARHPRIERYAWYPWTPNNELVAPGGALTPLGMTLANAPATR